MNKKELVKIIHDIFKGGRQSKHEPNSKMYEGEIVGYYLLKHFNETDITTSEIYKIINEK